MSRIALVPSEPIRARMAGIGIRYLEMARRLPGFGLEVVLVTAGHAADAKALLTGVEAVEVRPFARGRLAEMLADCDAVVSQGQLANDVVLELGESPVAIDLYDPFLVENLSYVESLGLDPYRNDHATWVLQLSRGDFFLCSSEEQRQYYLGFLTALGRVNPRRVAADPDLCGLVAPVSFGVPGELPPHEPYLPASEGGVRRLLFGGLYDWYDPWPVLEAVEQNRGEPWQLLFIHNPNPGTPQKLIGEVEDWCRQRGLWGNRVRVIDWVPSARRFDLLRDVDLLISTHRPTLETRLSLRTRFLEALAVGCPVITTEGGAVSRLLLEHGAGRVVPAGEPEAVAEAIRHTLAAPEAHRQGAATMLEAFAWDRVLEPLVAFCREPRPDPWRHEFAFHPPTLSPGDGLAFRLRRKLRHLLSR